MHTSTSSPVFQHSAKHPEQPCKALQPDSPNMCITGQLWGFTKATRGHWWLEVITRPVPGSSVGLASPSEGEKGLYHSWNFTISKQNFPLRIKIKTLPAMKSVFADWWTFYMLWTMNHPREIFFSWLEIDISFNSIYWPVLSPHLPHWWSIHWLFSPPKAFMDICNLQVPDRDYTTATSGMKGSRLSIWGRLN